MRYYLKQVRPSVIAIGFRPDFDPSNVDDLKYTIEREREFRGVDFDTLSDHGEHPGFIDLYP